MNGKDKIERILRDLGLKAPTLANQIGVPYSMIFDIQREKTKKISGGLAKAISSTFPQYPAEWLLEVGDGDMLIGDNSQKMTGSVSDVQGVVGLMYGDVHLNGGKDKAIEKLEEKDDQRQASHITHLNRFHDIMEGKDRYIERKDNYIKTQDEYIAGIVKHSYLRNKENMERLDDVIRQQNKLIEASNEDRREVRKQMDRILDMLEKTLNK
jgi:hypothetical protein